ncbi:MAG: sugar phosphate isomerase/epimerase family protein [Acidobacteriota bacterium]
MNRRDLLSALPVVVAGLNLPFGGSPAAANAKGVPRLRTAICAYSFREALKNKTMSYEDLVRLAVAHDVDGLDLTVYWFPDTSNSFLLPLKRLAYKMAVEIYSISIRTDLCRPTPELQAKEVAEIRKWVDVAERLGACHIRVFGGEAPKDATEDQAAGWVVEGLKRAGDYSASKGIILGLENHGGITSQAKRIVDIVKRVDSPWVGINLDTGNFHVADPYAEIAACVPYAVNTQFKSEIEGPDGRSKPSDWDRLVSMLAKGGYNGYLALEYEAAENPKAAVPRLMTQLRRLATKYSAG